MRILTLGSPSSCLATNASKSGWGMLWIICCTVSCGHNTHRRHLASWIDGKPHTSGVLSKTSASILSYGKTPILSPLRLVTKLTQHASSRGEPIRRMAFVSRPNWRHISRLRGQRAWALGAAKRFAYFSIRRDLTVLGVQYHVSAVQIEMECRYDMRSWWRWILTSQF